MQRTDDGLKMHPVERKSAIHALGHSAGGFAPMSPAEIKAIREALGMSQAQLANFLQMDGKEAHRTVRGWEAGTRNGRPAIIPGTVQVLLRAIIESAAVRHHFGLTLKAGRD